MPEAGEKPPSDREIWPAVVPHEKGEGMRSTTVFVLANALLVSLGCAELPRASSPSVTERAPVVRTSRSAAPAESAAKAPERKVGDFRVHMITGSFRKQPALLTERVTGHDAGLWTIEYTVEDTTGARGLRTLVDENGNVRRVTRLLDGKETLGTMKDYEALMASTSVIPDENDGLQASTKGTCTVGPSELDCETKSYKIWLGDKEASLGITASAALPGHDLSGEITAADGTVIFRSELLEHGNDADSKDAAVSLLGLD
jgi:hypothetical protein